MSNAIGNIVMLLFLALIIFLAAVYLRKKAPKYCSGYMGSNYVGGGNMEEQLAFTAGYKPTMSTY